MNFIIWILIGGVVGWLFSYLTKNRTKEARGVYILLGMIGSLLAALAWGQITEPVITWFDIELVGVALVGAAILIGIGFLFLRHSKKSDIDT